MHQMPSDPSLYFRPGSRWSAINAEQRAHDLLARMMARVALQAAGQIDTAQLRRQFSEGRLSQMDGFEWKA